MGKVLNPVDTMEVSCPEPFWIGRGKAMLLSGGLLYESKADKVAL
jgi:hypothetical protein